MNEKSLVLLASPGTDQSLEMTSASHERGSEALQCPKTGKRFPIMDGIPNFVDDFEVEGSNRKYRDLYNRFSPFYNLAQKLFYLFRGGEAKARSAYLKELEIKPGDRVLEVSVGTGANLRFLPRHAEYFGLDLSPGQLAQCRNMLDRTGIRAELFMGMAEALPFQSESFDCVFHMGGINFFGDKGAAIREMIRVAKPGTRIVIVDETEKLARRAALFSPFFRNREEPIVAPAHLVPPEMEELRVFEIRGGELFVLSFRKPPKAREH